MNKVREMHTLVCDEALVSTSQVSFQTWERLQEVVLGAGIPVEGKGM